MDEYFIGAGALLTAGPTASIAGATLHAQPKPGLAGCIEAALVDFEATQARRGRAYPYCGGRWSGARFRAEIVGKLLDQRECTLADVIRPLRSNRTREVHLFARWLPDEATRAFLPGKAFGCSRILSKPLGRPPCFGPTLERWHSPSELPSERRFRWFQG